MGKCWQQEMLSSGDWREIRSSFIQELEGERAWVGGGRGRGINFYIQFAQNEHPRVCGVVVCVSRHQPLLHTVHETL